MIYSLYMSSVINQLMQSTYLATDINNDQSSANVDLSALDYELIKVHPEAELEFNNNEVVMKVVPIEQSSYYKEGDLVALVGVEVRELDVLGYVLHWWPEYAIILSFFIFFLSFFKLKRFRKLHDIKNGERYCAKCFYNLTHCKSQTCPGCGCNEIHEGGKTS